jgi:hypothetical protein
VWVDQRTGNEFNVEIGARVVATQAGQIVLIDDNEQVSTSNDFSIVIIFSLGTSFSNSNKIPSNAHQFCRRCA